MNGGSSSEMNGSSILDSEQLLREFEELKVENGVKEEGHSSCSSSDEEEGDHAVEETHGYQPLSMASDEEDLEELETELDTEEIDVVAITATRGEEEEEGEREGEREIILTEMQRNLEALHQFDEKYKNEMKEVYAHTQSREIEITEERGKEIKEAMKNITLNVVPPWARIIPEEEWIKKLEKVKK